MFRTMIPYWEDMFQISKLALRSRGLELNYRRCSLLNSRTSIVDPSRGQYSCELIQPQVYLFLPLPGVFKVN